MLLIALNGSTTANSNVSSGFSRSVYNIHINKYGVATVSRIDKIIGLFCKRDLLKRRYSAKETCNLIDPTDRSHPISGSVFNMYINEHIHLHMYMYIYIYIYNMYVNKYQGLCTM